MEDSVRHTVKSNRTKSVYLWDKTSKYVCDFNMNGKRKMKELSNKLFAIYDVWIIIIYSDHYPEYMKEPVTLKLNLMCL